MIRTFSIEVVFSQDLVPGYLTQDQLDDLSDTDLVTWGDATATLITPELMKKIVGDFDYDRFIKEFGESVFINLESPDNIDIVSADAIGK